MISRKPTLVLWLLNKAGYADRARDGGRSFGTVFWINGLNFLLTWGVFFIVTGLLLGSRNSAAVVAAAVLAGSAAYGLLVAFSLPKMASEVEK